MNKKKEKDKDKEFIKINEIFEICFEKRRKNKTVWNAFTSHVTCAHTYALYNGCPMV